MPLDNNPVESCAPLFWGGRTFRGRSEWGTRVAALFYSLIASCTVIGAEPAAYLREAVRRAISDEKQPLLPTDFKAATQRSTDEPPSRQHLVL